MFVPALSFILVFIASNIGSSIQIATDGKVETLPTLPKDTHSAENLQSSSATHSTNTMLEKFSSMSISPKHKQLIPKESGNKNEVDHFYQQATRLKSSGKAPVRKLKRLGKIRLEKQHGLSPYARPGN
ncbi:uncharacterized protein FA14DRAFT_157206 [Meira miltonrushii]|uniref:Uncharacterized protein n=1 Tax=Meira miltonrushii TaxID=1280837 RepID=A0A316V4P5_9BASI|nr:uncharacterized protein FA14DRAFT_157206 [Meira miltonrushii]PWN32490.1 hypothetical protein FA14DRAFT_157206 [Meira miltonrushii]